MIETIIIALALFGGGYWTGASHEQAKQTELKLAIEQQAKLSQEAAAKEIAKIEIKHETINNQVIEKIRVEKVYQDCQHSEDTWRLIKEAYK